MTREHKLALILGFALVLGVGVLISDHFSGARRERIAAAPTDIQASAPETGLLQADGTLPPDESVIASNLARAEAARLAALTPPSTPVPATLADSTPASPPVTIDMRGPDAPASAPAGVRSTAQADPGDGVDPALRPFVERIIPDEPVAAVSTNGLTGHTPETSPNPDGGSERGAADPSADDALTKLIAGGPAIQPSAPAAGPREPGPGDRLHTVASGESLSKIAGRYYSSQSLWKKLADYNAGRIAADASVRAGQTILIPPKSVLTGKPESAAPASLTPSERPAPTPKPAAQNAAPRTYTVQSGDNLRKIARRMLGSEGRWTEILSMNAAAIKDANNVPAGIVLKLPPK